MIVCIAEKPSVALEIAKVLGAGIKKEGYYEGNGYQVTWTYGHLCQMKSPQEYKPEWRSWKLETLPMVPRDYEIELIPDPAVKKQFAIIKKLYKNAIGIVNCGDAGQEGELIQRYVLQLAGATCPVKRLWISSLTEESIRQGFRQLKDQSQYDNLYHAGRARACGDWLLGMNATRLYTLQYAAYGLILSIGRVQTPTLAMIVNRDQQIDHFKPEPYWVLTTKYRNTVFTSSLGKIASRQEGECLLHKVSGKPLVITDIQEKRGVEPSPQLYDLTSLQVDCNKKFGFSADTTLRTLQGLYEKKLTTYPRVDTRFLTTDLYGKCPEILSGLESYHSYVKPLLDAPLPKSRRIFDDSKVTDHHAIIPTGVVPSNLSDYEKRVYDVICRRFIAVFYPDCQFSTNIVLGKADSVAFKATGKSIQREGWRVLYAKLQQTEETDDDSEETNAVLPSFQVGETGVHQPLLQQKMTTPPKRYTEATLLQAMETAGKFVEDESLREAMKANGIGRPSSRATIIETLIKRGFVMRQKKMLVSSSTGKQLISRVKSTVLRSPELTGLWEKKLRDIEAGRYRWQDFMLELEQMLQSIIEDVKRDTVSEPQRIGGFVFSRTTPPPFGKSSSSGSIHRRRR